MKNINLLFVIALVVGSLLFTCESDPSTGSGSSSSHIDYERAHSPWVFRSVLDSIPRMVTLALNDKMWAAYSTEEARLYKVWKGFVNFDGAVYNTVHGPQPNTIGDAYISNPITNPWFIQKGDKKEIPEVKYKGHKYTNGQVTLMYDLISTDGKSIRVTETPEYISNEKSDNGFERIFTVDNEYQGMQVGLHMNIHSIADLKNDKGAYVSYETNSQFDVKKETPLKDGKISAANVEGTLLLHDDQPTMMRVYFVAKPLIKNKNKLEDDSVLEKPLGYKLIARNDCKSCHNTYRKTIGPAYEKIAQRYANTPENIEMLTKKVKAGGMGVWGQVMMNAHPNVPSVDIKEMVTYIMSLDADLEKDYAQTEKARKEMPLLDGVKDAKEGDYLPGVNVKVIKITDAVTKLDDINFNKKPQYEGIVSKVEALESDLIWAGDWFAMEYTGYISVPKDNNYVFRLISDDGSRLYIDDQLAIINDGFHGAEARDGELALKKGLHPFKVQFFQGSGGMSVQLQWNSFDNTLFKTIPGNALSHHKVNQAPGTAAKAPPLESKNKIAGDGYPLNTVHPSFDLSTARPSTFLPKVAGIDFKTDGTLVVSTWDAGGEVHIIENADSGDASKMRVKTIASGLAEPLGLKVVNDEIYILQKQELTKLIDNDGDEIIDEYRTINNDWEVSANFHEFAFGLVEKDGWLYGNLAIGILPGGASAPNQPPQRGSVFRVELASGDIEYIANGLRTPNGIGIGADDEVFVADNQGDWLPASKIVHVQKDAWYGSRAVDFEGTKNKKETLPVVWLPQNEIGNSPSQISYLKDGPYKGQMIHGEVTHGGIKRVFTEKVNGLYQGVVFRFIQGLEAGVNRIAYGPDGALYAGGIGSTGNWGHTGKNWYGLQKLKYNSKPTFEMLAVRAMSDGIEIEFTDPLRPGDGLDKSLYTIKQWRYQPTADYGGPKIDEKTLNVKEISISPNRKRVFLQLAGMRENHLVYVHLNEYLISENGLALHSPEAWYTMNQIPENKPGDINPNSLASTALAGQLTNAQKAAGWISMFDGKTTEGWRNYRKETIGKSWKVEDGALTLVSKQKPDGTWQAEDGGDIIYDQIFENFELEIEWKIAACGNSGIIYLVEESEKYDFPWMTGPEMQILDNTCHPDAKIEKHRAGDLYDIQACSIEVVKPAGSWNKARVVVKDGKVEHWLNGHKVVEAELFTDAWAERLKSTKWKDFADFGTKKKGKITLQDHGDRVWFRNIRAREL